MTLYLIYKYGESGVKNKSFSVYVLNEIVILQLFGNCLNLYVLGTLLQKCLVTNV